MTGRRGASGPSGPPTGFVDLAGEHLPADGRHLSALDRGFTLGDGVFETIRVTGGRPFRLGAHLARLRTSAAALRLPVPADDGELSGRIERLLAANDLAEAVVRLTVSRGVPAERGLLPPANPTPTVVVQASPHRALPPGALARGLAAATSAIRRNESSPLARIKSCNYLDNVLARLEAQAAGADEALLLNTAGHVTCASAANVHAVVGGRLLTPALDCGVLDGVTRQVVRELAARLGLRWEEGRLCPADLLAAEEAFLTNSVVGVAPLTRLDGRAIGSGYPGPATAALARAYEEELRGDPGRG